MAQTECQRWRELDERFDTDPRSPLHHDNRCRTCRQSTQKKES